MNDRIAQIRANAEKYWDEHPEQRPPTPWDNTFIPDIDDFDTPPPIDDGLDGFLNDWSVLDAYRRYCGKMEPNVGRRRESIMVSCPKPNHADKDPSAWLNLDKDTWFCGGCQEGGDKYDIAAYGLQFPVPGYKERFGDLRKQIAIDHGHTVVTSGTTERLIAPVDEADEADEPAEVIDLDPHAVKNDDYHEDTDPWSDEDRTLRFPELELHSVLPMNQSFVDLWIQEHRTIAPDLMNFWAALVGISMAVGRGFYLDDDREVWANIFCVMIAPSGGGKSSAINPIIRLIEDCFPYDVEDPNTIDVDVIDGPASGEALINKLDVEREIGVLPNGLPELERIPKRAFVTYDEFGTLAKKAGIQNSSLRETLQGLADARRTVGYSTRDHSKKAVEPYVSLVAGTQPGVLNNYVDQADIFSGFANRFMFIREGKVWHPGGYRSGHKPNVVLASSKLKDIRTKYEHFPMPVAQDAIADWDQYSSICHGWGVDDEDEANPMLTRMDLKFKKVALLLAANEMLDEITQDIVDRAMVIMLWLHDCALATGKDVSSGRVNDCSDEIIRAVKWTEATGKRNATFAVIKTRMNRTKSSNFQDDEIGRGIDLLTKFGALESHEGPTGVRHWKIADENAATTWSTK